MSAVSRLCAKISLQTKWNSLAQKNNVEGYQRDGGVEVRGNAVARPFHADRGSTLDLAPGNLTCLTYQSKPDRTSEACTSYLALGKGSLRDCLSCLITLISLFPFVFLSPALPLLQP